MKDLKISLKLIIGFGLILGLTVLIGIMGIIGINSVAFRVETTDNVNTMVKDLLQIREHEKNYVIRKEQSDINKINNLSDEITTYANATKTIFKDQYNKDEMNEIIRQTEAYNNAVAAYVLSEQTKVKKMELMRTNADIMLSEVDAILDDQFQQLKDFANTGQINVSFINDKISKAHNAADLKVLILNIRKNEKEIIISGEQTFYDLHSNEMNKIKNDIDNMIASFVLEKNIEQGKRTKKAIEDYELAFNSFVQELQNQNTLEQQMNSDAKKVLSTAQKTNKDQRAKMLAQIVSSFTLIGILAVLAAILGIIIAVVIIRGITVPISKGVIFAEKMSKGDLTVELDVNQKDEVGILAKSLELMVENVQRIIISIKDGARQITSGANEMSSNSQEISQGANEQASSIEEISSAIEQMTATINQNTEQALQAQKTSELAAENIKSSSAVVIEAVEAMKNIADKISIISDIADKTDLLAINAAVEAARAGEQGRGFAVVAIEIRKLAENTQNAAKEIEQLTGSSVKVADQAGIKLQAIVPEILDTAKLVKEISTTSIEQNSSANEISNSIQQFNNVTQQSAASTEELASSIEELTSQAEQLLDVVSFFKVNQNMNFVNSQNNYNKKSYSNKKYNANDMLDNEFEKF